MTISKPTTILTGFLGAGKTTYLNHLIKQNKNVRYAIIENEFGEKGIDTDLIIHPEDNIVELNNGCLCCTIQSSLYDILSALFDRREEFDEIIIEATGVANPIGLAAPFVTHRAIKEVFPLVNITCLIDAELVQKQLNETEEAISQISYSDVLIINKADLVTDSKLKEIEGLLKSLNPLALVEAGYQNHYPERIYGQRKDLFNELQIKEQPNGKAGAKNHVERDASDGHGHHHHEHTKVVSHTFEFTQPFRREVLYQQLLVYLTFQAEGLYRMKGLVWFEGSENQHIVQSVGKRLDIQEKKEPNLEPQRASTIVFIGKDLKRAGLEKLLNRCLSQQKVLNH